MFTACDDAGAGDQAGLACVALVFVAGDGFGWAGFAVDVNNDAFLEDPALPVAFCFSGGEGLAVGAEPGCFDEPAESVVAVLDVGLAAAGATGTAYVEQAVFVADDGVGVGGGLTEAVGEDGFTGSKAEVDLFDAGAGNGLAGFVETPGVAFDAEDATALGVVGPGVKALGRGGLFVGALPCDADAREQGGVGGVFVVVMAADLSGQVDADEVGEEIARVAGVSFYCCATGGIAGWSSTAIGIAKAANRAVDMGNAVEAVGVALGRIAQDEAAALGVGDVDEDAGGVAGQADEFAGGGFDLDEFALLVKAKDTLNNSAIDG